jgi:hypothetical protein
MLTIAFLTTNGALSALGLSWQQGPLGRNPNGLEPGQNVTSHGIDRNLSIDEAGALLTVAAA